MNMRLIYSTRGKSDERLTNPAVWQSGQDGVAVQKLQQDGNVLIAAQSSECNKNRLLSQVLCACDVSFTDCQNRISSTLLSLVAAM